MPQYFSWRLVDDLDGWLWRAHSWLLRWWQMENGEPIPLWFVMAFVGPWFFVAFLLLYSNFARKRFRLTADMLHIETRLLLLRWSVSIPRGTISEIQQVKDGGEGDDSFQVGGSKSDPQHW